MQSVALTYLIERHLFIFHTNLSYGKTFQCIFNKNRGCSDIAFRCNWMNTCVAVISVVINFIMNSSSSKQSQFLKLHAKINTYLANEAAKTPMEAFYNQPPTLQTHLHIFPSFAAKKSVVNKLIRNILWLNNFVKLYITDVNRNFVVLCPIDTKNVLQLWDQLNAHRNQLFIYFMRFSR